MKKIGKALVIGFALETVVMGIAVILGFTSIPLIFYSPVFIPDDSMLWLRIPLALSQYPGFLTMKFYHEQWHFVHQGVDSDPNPQHLFIIVFVVNFIFYSLIAFVYLHWKSRRKNKRYELKSQPR